MIDAFTSALVGGALGLIPPLLNFLLDCIKHKSTQKNSIEEQKLQFMKTLMDRLDRVSQERDDAEEESDKYKVKFWEAYEERRRHEERNKRGLN